MRFIPIFGIKGLMKIKKIIIVLAFIASMILVGCSESPEEVEIKITMGATEFLEQFAPSETVWVPTETTIPTPSTLFVEVTEPEPIILDYGVNWYSDYRVYITRTTTDLAGGYEFDIKFLAKLLSLEARGMTWEGKVYTCSAILNLCDLKGRSLWSMGHDSNVFTGAEYVDNMKPTDDIYEVIDYVLGGARVEEICYFRTKKYHSFGTPVCEVDGHYFSKN